MRRHAFACLVPLALGCAIPRVTDESYQDGHTAYRVGALGEQWRRRDVGGGNLAFVHPAGGTIVANATCAGIKDLPLDVLTRQELFGVEQKQEKRREVVTLDGRAALRTQWTGTLDGVPVAMDLVVLKKDACTYDLALVSAEEVFPARDEDFWRFVTGFHEREHRG
jgi:hypothetical protein